HEREHLLHPLLASDPAIVAYEREQAPEREEGRRRLAEGGRAVREDGRRPHPVEVSAPREDHEAAGRLRLGLVRRGSRELARAIQRECHSVTPFFSRTKCSTSPSCVCSMSLLPVAFAHATKSLSAPRSVASTSMRSPGRSVFIACAVFTIG